MDGRRTDKAEVIAYAREQVPQGYDMSRMLMVGDRLHDIVGAKKHNMDSVGVLFGYGSEKELKEAGATYLVNEPLDIIKIVEMEGRKSFEK